ncbi:MAG: sigma D regulator [Halomonadaceae bacterium]|nr:MAG: sigma D regulator [Halomonadaceae bacterium]
MLGDCENAKERWGGVHELIDRWLKERQQLIVSYCALSGADASQPQALFDQLSELCQLMLDYVSAGHFEVYEQLIKEARDFNDGGLEMAKRVYPRISKTTQEMLAFNDLLDISEPNEEDMRSMLGRVSYLGELMEERFELEDLLIETLHNVHADQVA